MAAAANPAAPPSRERLIRSVLVVMGGFLFTKGISLAQTVIIAGRFGAGAEYDTYALASQIPDAVVRLIGLGALGVAFIPAFSALLNREDHEAAWRLASQIFNTILLTALAISLLILLTAPALVSTIVAPGLSDSDAEQTANLMRILSFSSLFFCLSGIITGVLHGHNHFFLPVLAPVFQDLGLLFGVIFFTPSMGVYGLVWGTVLGAFLHAAIQIPGLIRFRFQWRAALGWRDPELRRVLTLMLPRVLEGGTLMLITLAIGNINSRMGEGAASAFSWSIRIMDIPQSLIGTATGIVLFPTLAALSSSGRLAERREAFTGAMGFIIVATFPAMAGLLLVGYPALRLLFDEYDSAVIFTSLQVMSLAVVIQSLHEILTRAFYAQEDTLRPLIISTIATVFSITTVIGGYAIYQAQNPPLWSPLAVGFPALAYVLSFLIEAALLTVLLRRRWGDIGLPRLRNTTLRAIAATAAMIAAVLLTQALLNAAGFAAYTGLNSLLKITLSIGVGALTYGAVGWVLGIGELRQLWGLVKERRRILAGGAA